MTAPPTAVLYQYKMGAQLIAPPYTPVIWTVYNQPDLSGAQSGYVGLIQNIIVESVLQLSNGTAITPPAGPAGGDLSGQYPNPQLGSIDGNPISLGTLGAQQDGYALVWHNALGQLTASPVAGSGGGGYENIEAAGIPVTARTTMNFVGATIVDNAGFARTDITIQPNALEIQSIAVAATAPTTTGQVLVYNAGGNQYAPQQLTQDQILPAFAPSISPTSAGPFELGAAYTPSITSSPAYNASGVTLATKSDNQGHANVTITSNPFSSPLSTYTITTPTALQIFATFTQNGVGPRSTGNLAATWCSKVWFGVGTAGATGFNGVTGALIGATGTLSGSLSTNGLVAFSPTPSNQKVYYACDTSYGLRSFKDASGNPFSMLPTPTTVLNVANANAVQRNFYLYESTNLLSSVANPVSPS